MMIQAKNNVLMPSQHAAEFRRLQQFQRFSGIVPAGIRSDPQILQVVDELFRQAGHRAGISQPARFVNPNRFAITGLRRSPSISRTR